MNGEPLWKRDDFGQMETLNAFGEGSSPTLSGDMILVPWDHNGPSALYALDKRTGKTIWKADRDEPTEWSTPIVVEHAGRKTSRPQRTERARSYDLETERNCGIAAGKRGGRSHRRWRPTTGSLSAAASGLISWVRFG